MSAKCKLLQLLGILSPRPPTGALPLDSTGDFHAQDPLGYSLQMKILGVATAYNIYW